jgi:hypothetical protein
MPLPREANSKPIRGETNPNEANFREGRAFGELPWNVRFVAIVGLWKLGSFAIYGIFESAVAAARLDFE